MASTHGAPLPCPHCGELHPEDVLICPREDRPLPLEGRLLDRKFRLVQQLGRGGMGEVWRAENILVRRGVAIKILHPEYARNENTLQRFHQEATAAGRIQNPHICDILDLGQGALGPYIVMELLNGRNLGELFDEVERLEPGLAVMIVRQALEGLDAAHRAGIVHRDLKPENIFLHEPAPGRLLVKLMDFGISKFTEGVAKQTRQGVLMGTPEYMSPEQADGAANVDARTDVWAIGAVLYRALSGKEPFLGPTLAATLMNVTLNEPTPLATLASGVPEGLVRTVHWCLRKDREQRPASAQELSDALRPYDHLDAGATKILAPPAPPVGQDGASPVHDEGVRAHSPTVAAQAGGASMVGDPSSSGLGSTSISALSRTASPSLSSPPGSPPTSSPPASRSSWDLGAVGNDDEKTSRGSWSGEIDGEPRGQGRTWSGEDVHPSTPTWTLAEDRPPSSLARSSKTALWIVLVASAVVGVGLVRWWGDWDDAKDPTSVASGQAEEKPSSSPKSAEESPPSSPSVPPAGDTPPPPVPTKEEPEPKPEPEPEPPKPSGKTTPPKPPTKPPPKPPTKKPPPPTPKPPPVDSSKVTERGGLYAPLEEGPRGSYAQASATCTRMRRERYAGLTGWRMASAAEIKRFASSLPKTLYWTRERQGSQGKTLNLFNGDEKLSDLDSTKARALCVSRR